MSHSHLAKLQCSLQHSDPLRCCIETGYKASLETFLLLSSYALYWLVCAAQASVLKLGQTIKCLCYLTLVHLCLIFWPGRLLRNLRVACRSFDRHPSACVTVKALAAERSPGCPSMALSLALGDNAVFPCHKADAVLLQHNTGPIWNCLPCERHTGIRMPTTVWGFLTCHSIMSTHWKEKGQAALTGIVISA